MPASKKILGLDLGTTSIGWSFIELMDEKPVFVKSGVRIIPLTVDERDAFNSGNAISTNADRRMKRGARKTLDRYQLRREKLIRYFLKAGWIEDRSVLQKLESWKIWELRNLAATSQISMQDLCAVLLHLNTKRGFKSNRKTDSAEETASDFIEGISANDRMVLELGYTIGQWYWNEHSEARAQNAPMPAFRGKTFSRKLHREEFDRIWAVQAKFHPELTEEAKVDLGDRTIYYQRRLKSAKHLVGKCPFFPSKRVIPASHPLFQLYRAWHEVNNLRLYHSQHNTLFEIPLELKEQLVEQLHEVKKLTAAAIIKTAAKFHGVTTRQMKASVEAIPGMETRISVETLFRAWGVKRPELLDFDPLVEGQDFDKQPALLFWHVLYSVEDTDDLREVLHTRYGFTVEQSEALAKVRLREGHGSLSARFIRRLMPFLMEGNDYTTACSLAGYRHSFHQNKEESEKRMLLDALPPVKRGDLRNPVVEKVLNQLVNVTNAILAHPEMGRPDEIHVEMGRELTASAKQRKGMERSIKDNQILNQQAAEELEKLGLRQISRKDIIKWRLGEECNWISLYTGKPIDRASVFRTDAYDVEHIIPRSRLFDDSLSNKTLCESELNRKKGNMTAYDFMERQGEIALESYLERVNSLYNAHGIKKGKYLKLIMKLEEIPNDFISRQLNETQYIAREALTRLKVVTREVLPTVGSLTAHLRHEWGLDDVIKELQIPKYQESGMTTVRTDKGGNQHVDIEGWTKRDDHRHHALDAFVVALTSRKLVKRANELSQSMGGYDEADVTGRLNRKERLFTAPDFDVRRLASEAMAQVLIAYKSGQRVASWSKNTIKVKGGYKTQRQLIPRGPLHKETVLGKRLQYSPKPIALKDIANPEWIVNTEERAAFESYLNANGGDPKLAFSTKNLKKEPFLVLGKEQVALTCWETRFTKRVAINEKLKVADVVDGAVRKVLQARLEAYDNSPKKAFADLEANPIWLNQAKGIFVEKVTVFDGASDLLPLHENAQGMPVDYVYTRNNHHLALYQKPDGKYHLEAVTLLEAVQRKQQGMDLIRKNHPEGYRFIVHFERNHYFYFGERGTDVSPSEPGILDRIFRTQKMTLNNAGGPDIFFRHNHETDIQRENQFSFKRSGSIGNLPSHAVEFNVLGEILNIKPILYTID
jgi:CRISPR-associated endonuclease Csn1